MKCCGWMAVVGMVVLSAGIAWGQVVPLASDRGPTSPDQNWQIGFTPSYSSGNFGTNTTSSFFYAPISIRRLFPACASIPIPPIAPACNLLLHSLNQSLAWILRTFP